MHHLFFSFQMTTWWILNRKTKVCTTAQMGGASASVSEKEDVAPFLRNQEKVEQKQDVRISTTEVQFMEGQRGKKKAASSERIRKEQLQLLCFDCITSKVTVYIPLVRTVHQRDYSFCETKEAARGDVVRRSYVSDPTRIQKVLNTSATAFLAALWPCLQCQRQQNVCS